MNTKLNCYVVNSAVYNNVDKPEAVDAEVRKIVEKSAEISGKNRKVVVVIGLNVPNDSKATDAQMKEAVKRAEAIAKTAKKDNFEVRVVEYRWDRFDKRLKPLDFKANERINYVAIRNNLFYSKENQETINTVIQEAGTHDHASVKFLALDGDSDISAERVAKLEEHWDSSTNPTEKKDSPSTAVKLPPLITSGFYRFDFDAENVKLVGPGGEMNWGMYLATIENAVDLESKQLLSGKEFNSNLLYRKLNLPENDDAITDKYILERIPKFQKNLFVLDKTSTESRYDEKLTNMLKIHLCDILAVSETYKEVLRSTTDEDKFTLPIIHKRLVTALREIEKIEKQLEGIEETKYSIPTKGDQVLYPSENVMFVSLYDKVGHHEFNVYNEMSAAVQSSANKTRKLWGNDVGREEGENIAVQMKKFWEKTRGKEELSKTENTENVPAVSNDDSKRALAKAKAHRKVQQNFTKDREVVAYSQVFTTGLPPRAHKFLTKEQIEIGERLPQSAEELKRVIEDPKKLEKLVDDCVALISSRSQTSLSKKFLNQRLRYIKAVRNADLIDPAKKLSVFTRSVRHAVAEAFEECFQEFHNDRIQVLRDRVRDSIIKSAQESI